MRTANLIKITNVKNGARIRVSFDMVMESTSGGNPYVLSYVEGGPLSFCLSPEEAKSVRIERLDQ